MITLYPAVGPSIALNAEIVINCTLFSSVHPSIWLHSAIVMEYTLPCNSTKYKILRCESNLLHLTLQSGLVLNWTLKFWLNSLYLAGWPNCQGDGRIRVCWESDIEIQCQSVIFANDKRKGTLTLKHTRRKRYYYNMIKKKCNWPKLQTFC